MLRGVGYRSRLTGGGRQDLLLCCHRRPALRLDVANSRFDIAQSCRHFGSSFVLVGVAPEIVLIHQRSRPDLTEPFVISADVKKNDVVRMESV